jgi:hypothetical protein
MRRRVFVAGLGVTAAWPIRSQAQQQKPKTVGILLGFAPNDPEANARIAAFRRGLHDLG